MNPALIYPLIIAAGVLQAWGPPMNGALRVGMVNPWLASMVSFLPIIACLFVLWVCMPMPMPTLATIQAMPWWAPLAGVIGAFAVVAGLMFVNTVGAGAFAGLLITANILMSLLIDHYGLFGVERHALNLPRLIGGALMVGGIALIARF